MIKERFQWRLANIVEVTGNKFTPKEVSELQLKILKVSYNCVTLSSFNELDHRLESKCTYNRTNPIPLLGQMGQVYQ